MAAASGAKGQPRRVMLLVTVDCDPEDREYCGACRKLWTTEECKRAGVCGPFCDQWKRELAPARAPRYAERCSSCVMAEGELVAMVRQARRSGRSEAE